MMQSICYMLFAWVGMILVISIVFFSPFILAFVLVLGLEWLLSKLERLKDK